MNRTLLKKLLHLPLVLGDLDDIDSSLSKNLQFILENDVQDLGATFEYSYKDLGDNAIIIELIPGGHDIEVK